MAKFTNAKGKSISNEVIVQFLTEIKDEEGIVTPREVIRRAIDKKSPVHDWFTWDKDAALEKHLLWEARQLIASARVIMHGRQTDAFYNTTVHIDDVPVRGYFSVDQVLSNEEMYQRVLREAVRELRYWQTKYKEIKELKGIVDDNMLGSLNI